MRRAHRALLMAVLLSPVVAGSDPAPVVCPHAPEIAANTVTVRVLGPELDQRNFVITENRKPQKICGAYHFRPPASIGILLDTSGSMRGTRSDLFSIATAGLKQFLTIFGPQDEYFLQYVSEVLSTKPVFSKDLASLSTRLQVQPYGRTRLTDALYLALNNMQSARNPARALLVVSDAQDNDSIYTFEELSRMASEVAIPIFLFIAADPSNRASDASTEPEARNDFIRLADNSGGYASMVSTKQEAIRAATQFAEAIRSVYLLYYEHSGPNPPTKVRVDVKGVRPRPLVLQVPRPKRR